MPFNPRPYGLVDVPQGNPLQSLSQLMQLSRQFQGHHDDSKERARVQRVEKALNTGKGDPDAAAGLLEEQGDWTSARTLRDKAVEIRTKSVDDIMGRLNEHKTIYGQSAQALTELQTRPDLYPQVRPKLVELASALDPNLAAEIPEQYDPEKVNGMLQFVTGGAADIDIRARGLSSLKAGLDRSKDDAERTTSFRRSLGDWLSTSKSAEEWDAVKENGAGLGIPRGIIDEFGEWDSDAPTRARTKSMTPAERATDARAAVDDKRLADAAKATEKYRAAQLSIGRQREARLATQDRSTVSTTGKATAERWKADALDDLETEFTDPLKEMTEADLRRRQLTIENSYRAQIGAPALKALPKAWTGPDDAEAPPVALPAAPATKAPATARLSAGTTTIVEQNGVRYRVTTDATGKVLSADPVD